MRPLLTIALLAGLVPAAPVPKALKKPDCATRLLGGWRLTSRTMDGQESKIDDIVYVFSESQVQYRDMVGNSGTWTYTLDPTSTPPKCGGFRDPATTGTSCLKCRATR